jgi:trimeric autotransporter adhesin
VSTPSYEIVTNNNSATDTATTIDPDLSTSTKQVLDVNGGEASPGDTLRYTLTLTESAGGQAVNVSLTDNIPDNTSFGGFVSIPAGASSSFTAPPAGANGNGIVNVSGITVPASGSVTVVFDVTVIAGTLPGETVANTAVITNPNGPENNPAAPTLTVNPSLIPATGTKFLYLHRNGAAAKSLSRVVPTASDTNETVVTNVANSFTLTPSIRQTFSIAAGSIPVRLWITRVNGGAATRPVTVQLSNGAFTTSVAASISPNTGATPTLFSFSLPNTQARTFAVGSTFTLTITNPGTNLIVYPNGNGTAGNNSRIEFNATTVVNVDSVSTWNAAFNGGAAQATFYPGQNVFVRAQVSDPFGSFDIGGASISIVDPANVTLVNNLAMTPQGSPATCGSTTAATCIYQFQYTVPASPALGGWTIRITAAEGTEGTVTDLGVGNFMVVIPQPALTIVKSSVPVSDPVSLTVNPKRLPGAVVSYSIAVTNSGPGTVDSGTLVLTDAIPPNSQMYVSTVSGNPVTFTNGSTASGLTYDYATHVSYSSTGVTGPWTYVPVPDANGFDPTVRAVRIAPTGAMSAAGGGNPSFTVQFRVKIN